MTSGSNPNKTFTAVATPTFVWRINNPRYSSKIIWLVVEVVEKHQSRGKNFPKLEGDNQVGKDRREVDEYYFIKLLKYLNIFIQF